MRLYHSPTTPFGRKVMVLIHEAGLLDRVEVVGAAGSPLDPGSMPLDRNPLGKIPALDLGEQGAIYDSRVICRYLDNLSGAGLYPQGDALWPVLTLEATADGILEAALSIVYENRMRPEEKRFEPWVAGQWQKVQRTLDAVEGQWMGLLNGPVTMAHVALGCALGYLDFRMPDRAWRMDHPRLAAWEAEFSARPAMAMTRPVG
jgi:glutathione S-transferase